VRGIFIHTAAPVCGLRRNLCVDAFLHQSPVSREHLSSLLPGVDVVKTPTSEGVLFHRRHPDDSEINNRASVLAKRPIYGSAVLVSEFGRVLYGA
jgi:hypothetical protein